MQSLPQTAQPGAAGRCFASRLSTISPCTQTSACGCRTISCHKMPQQSPFLSSTVQLACSPHSSVAQPLTASPSVIQRLRWEAQYSMQYEIYCSYFVCHMIYQCNSHYSLLEESLFRYNARFIITLFAWLLS